MEINNIGRIIELPIMNQTIDLLIVIITICVEIWNQEE